MWLGSSEDSDAHIVYVDGRVGEHHTIRRLAENDPRRWDLDTVRNLTMTPWRLQDVEVRAQAAAATSKETTRFSMPSGAMMTPAAVDFRAEQIVLRPSTPGCAACAKRGLPSHGFRHSVECKRRRHSWLETQLGPPQVEDVPMVPAEVEIPVRPTRQRGCARRPLWARSENLKNPLKTVNIHRMMKEIFRWACFRP